MKKKILQMMKKRLMSQNELDMKIAACAKMKHIYTCNIHHKYKRYRCDVGSTGNWNVC